MAIPSVSVACVLRGRLPPALPPGVMVGTVGGGGGGWRGGETWTSSTPVRVGCHRVEEWGKRNDPSAAVAGQQTATPAQCRCPAGDVPVGRPARLNVHAGGHFSPVATVWGAARCPGSTARRRRRPPPRGGRARRPPPPPYCFLPHPTLADTTRKLGPKRPGCSRRGPGGRLVAATATPSVARRGSEGVGGGSDVEMREGRCVKAEAPLAATADVARTWPGWHGRRARRRAGVGSIARARPPDTRPRTAREGKAHAGPAPRSESRPPLLIATGPTGAVHGPRSWTVEKAARALLVKRAGHVWVRARGGWLCLPPRPTFQVQAGAPTRRMCRLGAPVHAGAEQSVGEGGGDSHARDVGWAPLPLAARRAAARSRPASLF